MAKGSSSMSLGDENPDPFSLDNEMDDDERVKLMTEYINMQNLHLKIKEELEQEMKSSFGYK